MTRARVARNFSRCARQSLPASVAASTEVASKRTPLTELS
jgi:hypothetical protein